MNRSILIVICDFLLVSLLMFATPDLNQVAEQNRPPRSSPAVLTNRPDSGQDLAAVMRLALEEERHRRDQLQGQLVQQQTLLSEREQQIQAFQEQVQSKGQQAQRLAEEKARLDQQFAAAQTNLLSLSRQLAATRTDALTSKEKAAAIEAGLRQQQAEAAALEQRLAELAQSNRTVWAEKQQLADLLQRTEAEKRAATQQVAQMKDEVQVVRQEKARLVEHADQLAEGVKVLAGNSGELAASVKNLATQSTALRREIRENRPLAPNTVFSQLATNRVQVGFFGSHSGLLGIDLNKRRDTETVLVTNGTNTFAVCHVTDTPLTFSDPGTTWVSLTGALARDQALVPVASVSFSRRDPRIVLIPVTATQARELGCAVYPVSLDPFKFQDAIIVGAKEGYYGQCRFQMDLDTPGYLRMDRNFLKGLFGKFNPSRGDLVFSQSGELLGIMVNGTYCVLLPNFEAVATLPLGEDIRAQHTEVVLSDLYGAVVQLPLKLQ